MRQDSQHSHITAFQEETGNNFYKEIPLSEILAVETRTAETEHFLFEIRTANLDYFVGSAEDAEEGDGLEGWEAAIRQSLMPAGASGASGTAAAAAEPCAEKSPDSQVDISQSYQIFPDEVLGSGQFGIVYGGVHRWSGVPGLSVYLLISAGYLAAV